MKEELQIRVRYNETDSMKYVYHGNYATYFHASRTELLRKVGLDDKTMEMNGIILPVVEMNVKYIQPAVYDELLTVKTSVKAISACKLYFNHQIFNANNVLINQAETTIAYVNSSTRKPIAIPKEIKERLNILTSKN
ncbi:MAG: hypothetical protein A2W98_15190 [Bacteroidetes bacterium GWF2_33_38]|nr:MAG: hypothetical protein A2W98_15190 [Bacteroidetes bacterium GWF2_33_38]OFY74800.1 MAG: hypothetical protein A2265_07550 [Bacteroidetes bacterium RIFOXYA12_FULL_33_9]OFY89915.1 MAG: hypothetical protein A2236_09950 [Bacteroidetes bacterium RIFOXYA2_FULL_33_7]